MPDYRSKDLTTEPIKLKYDIIADKMIFVKKRDEKWQAVVQER